MLNPNLEIFDEEYTKKIKLVAKIDTVIDSNPRKIYFINSHDINYVLDLSIKTNMFGNNITNIDIFTAKDYFEIIQKLNKNLTMFYIPEEKSLMFLNKNNEWINFDTLSIKYTKNLSYIVEKINFKKISYIDFMTSLGKEVKQENIEIDYINMFLRNTQMCNPRPAFVFADGTTLSIQASAFTYCLPRTNNASIYEAVECGFPSDPIEKIFEYAEEKGYWTNTVYPYTPVSVLNEIIKEKGIDKEFEARYLSKEIEI